MRRALKWIGRGLAALAALMILAAVGGYFWLRTSLPQVGGSISVAGLSAPVEIARDDRGVPTINAKSLNDAYFALGFAHAQDRLFQMELMRRVGAGRPPPTPRGGGPSAPTPKRPPPPPPLGAGATCP